MISLTATGALLAPAAVADAAPKNVCHLLPASAVGKIVGLTVSKAVESDTGPMFTCEYLVGSGGPVLNVQVNEIPSGQARSLYDASLKLAGRKGRRIAGVGDGAYQEGLNINVLTSKGTYFAISWTSPKTAPAFDLKAAKLIAPKL